MNLTFNLILFLCVVAAAPALKRENVDAGLVPEFGHEAGLNPTGTGDCDGIINSAGVVVKVPCFCPPPRADFIKALNANVAAGHAVNNSDIKVSFPMGNERAAKVGRMVSALVTLQNLRGAGVGCPAASTTFGAQLKAIQDGMDVDPALVPEFGHQAGLNPTGTGDCDGITNAQGQVVKIPCSCPPDRADFIKALRANVAAGHAVNNTGVGVSFPVGGDDKASRLARVDAAIVTLQNIRGAGDGCPGASTTFGALRKGILEEGK